MLALALVVCAVCDGEKATSPTQTAFAGTFTLRTVNGTSLPFVHLLDGQNSTALTGDAITIADDGSWSETGNFRNVNNGVTSNQPFSNHGTWSRSGNSIVLQSTLFQLSGYSGTFTSTQLTLMDGFYNYIFTK